MGRGKPVNRSLWPPEGTHRRFLELLDKVHRDNGTKSLRVIAASMHLRAHSRVDMLLRGLALPADDNQAENLIRALGGAAEDIKRGLKLYRAARSPDDARPAPRGGDAHARRSYAPTAAVAPAAAAQLPAQITAFAGRKDELTKLAGLLDPVAAPGTTLVLALAGPPGVGKTALAIEAGYAAARRGWFPGGALFIDLHGYDSKSAVQPGQALDVLLRSLRVPAEHIPPTAEERAAMYRSALAGNREPILLIIDNASAEAQVRPLLPGAGPHRVVVTSRQTLAGLSARLIDVAVFDPEAALTLLDCALRLGRPEDDRVSSDRSAAGRVAQFCGGLPLALQIIASLLKADPALQVSQLGHELRVEKLERLRYDDGSGLNAPSVAAAFELSYRQLDETSARLFRMLSVHPGPDTSTAVVAVLAGLPVSQARRILGGLAQAHLAEVTATVDPRWRMHDLLRLYAGKLGDEHADADGREEARDRLLGYFVALAAAADEHLRALPGPAVPTEFPDRNAAMAWLNDERESLVAALSMAADTGREEAALALSAALALHLSMQRRYDDMLATAETGLDAARRLGGRDAQAGSLNNLGVALGGLRRFDEAITAYRDAIATYRDIGDRRGEATALTNLGSALREARRFDEAVNQCEDAVVICRDTGDRHGEGNALSELGVALRHLGRFEDAIIAHRNAAAIFGDKGDRAGQAQAIAALGLALDDAGRHKDAITAHQETAATYRAMGDSYGEATALNNLGSALREAGRLEEAITAHQEAAARYQEMGERHREGNALNNLGIALQSAERSEEAVTPLRDAAACYRETRDRHREGIALGNLGLALLEAGQPQEAITPSSEAVAIFRDTGDRRREGRALGNLGVAMLLTGHHDEGITMSREAVAILLERGDQLSSKFPPMPGGGPITITGVRLPQADA